MSATLPSAAPDPRTARIGSYLLVLDRLVRIGTNMAEELDPTPDPTRSVVEKATNVETFDRVARAIRRTMLLADKFDESIDLARKQAELRETRMRTLARTRPNNAPHSDPETNPETASDTESESESESAERAERLDPTDSIADLEDRPIAEVATTLTRELGLTDFGIRPPSRRAPDHVPGVEPRAAADDEDDPDPKEILEQLLRYGAYARDG